MKIKYIRLIIFTAIFILAILIIYIVKINKNNLNIDGQIINVPEMILEYGIDHFEINGNFKSSEIIYSGTSDWYYYDGRQIIAMISCSSHPLDNQNDFVKIIGRDKLGYHFHIHQVIIQLGIGQNIILENH